MPRVLVGCFELALATIELERKVRHLRWEALYPLARGMIE